MIDSHVHITLPGQNVLHHRLDFSEYITKIESLGGGKGIVFLNPFDNKYCCPNSSKDNRLHKSIVRDITMKSYAISCKCCGTTHYVGEDVFRKDNVELLNLAQNHDMYALAFLTASGMSIQNQVEYYEKKYPAFLGYKIHPTIMMFPAEKLQIHSNKTIVFHSGNDEFASPSQILEFAKNYSGNVVVAHFARFDKVSLREITQMENVWIDMSPFTFLFGLIKSKPAQLCDTWNDVSNKGSMAKMFYAVADCVGIDKILFASDAPFGDLSTETEFIDTLGLGNIDFSKIMEDNAKVAFGL